MSRDLPTDRLWRLSTLRVAALFHGLTTPALVLAATKAQREQLRHNYGPLRQVVQNGNRDVLRLLFLPRDPVDWRVAGIDYDPGQRLLSVGRMQHGYTKERIVSLSYRVDDDGSQERQAWAALQDALPAGAAPDGSRE